jgi:hypothetical protein
MLSNQVTVSSVAASTALQINSRTFFSGVALLVTLSSDASGVTYDVEVSGDPQNVSAPTRWNKHDELSGKTASANSNLAYPVCWVRLNVTAISAGSVTLSVVQCG